MDYKNLPAEFGRWLGAQEEKFMIFVEPVAGSGAFVTIVSDPEQVEAAFKAYQDVFTTQAAEILFEMEQRQAEEDD